MFLLTIRVQQLEQQKKVNRKSDHVDEQKKNFRKSDYNEQLLLKEWDLDKIFKGFSDRLDQIKQESNRKERGSPEMLRTESPKNKVNHEGNCKNVQEDLGSHRRNDSDSRLPSCGFRRENSDFFPASSRHSAIFLETKSISDKNDGLFSRTRRGSEATAAVAGFGKKSDAEPILVDYSQNGGGNMGQKNSSMELGSGKACAKDSPKSKFVNAILDLKKNDLHIPLRPRREKTDGEIVMKSRSDKRHDLRDELEVRRLEVEERFSREAERMRRRSNLPSESFEGGNVNGGFNGSINDFESSLNSLSFSDLHTQVSLFIYLFIYFLFLLFFPESSVFLCLSSYILRLSV